MSDSLQPLGLQHARLFCPPLSSGVCSNSSPLSQWCYLTIIFCHSLLLLHSVFPSIRVFSNESPLWVRWPKYWSFSFNSSPSHLISFRMDWFDLLVVQGTLSVFSQHHNSNSSIFWCSVFFIVHLWHSYMTTGKTIALTIWTTVGKVMSLLFNILSSFIIAFLARNGHHSQWFWSLRK